LLTPAFHVTVICKCDGLVVIFVGAKGTVATVVGLVTFDGTELELVPRALVAFTEKL